MLIIIEQGKIFIKAHFFNNTYTIVTLTFSQESKYWSPQLKLQPENGYVHPRILVQLIVFIYMLYFVA